MMNDLQFGKWLADGQYCVDSSAELLAKHYLLNHASSKNELVFKIIEEDGVYSINKQEWDSSFFGFNIARLEIYNNPDNLLPHLSKFHNWALNNNINYITTRVSLSNVLLVNHLTQNGYCLLTNKYMLRCVINDVSLPELPEFQFNFLSKEEYDLPKNLINNSFTYSRFNIDSIFDSKRVGEMYSSWMRDFISQENNHIITLKDQNKIIGFCAFSKGINLYQMNGIVPKHGFIALIAVDKEYRGKGLGKHLLNKSKNYLKALGINLLFANVDIANTSSLNTFQSCEFKVFNLISEFKINL
ncbi:MAG: GNAT family N-acetyltransferase [Bacteroidia bacterium]|jgi:dTDP-4-amino-4,6-dideoxy-D-galactose acyltransferase